MSKVIAEEESDARNITSDAHNLYMNNFSQSPVTTNKQGENANAILTSGRINNSDTMAKTLKYWQSMTMDIIINMKMTQKSIRKATQR